MDEKILTRRSHALATRIASRLSLMDPRFNLREIAKQMVLLEDHLAHPYKVCPDCIRKHLMTIEAFAEEATTLNTDHQIKDPAVTEAIAEAARQWMEQFTDGLNPKDLAQSVRALRKRLIQWVYDPRAPEVRVASIYRHRSCHHVS